MTRVLLACTVAFTLSAPATAELPKPAAAKLLGLDGQPATLNAVRGKAATAVVFISFDCPVSNSSIAGLNELAKSHAEQGLAVILVCPCDEAAADVKKAAAGFKLSIPVLLDPNKELAAALKATTTPEAVLLDATGTVRYRGRIDDAWSARLKRNPKVTSFDLANAVEDVLAGKPVRTARTTPIGCVIDFDTSSAKAGEVTYHRDIAPILQKHCANCHRPGEVGPFSLTSYKQARRWSTDIKEYTSSRQMPPWMPGRAGQTMRGERKLTDQEIAVLAKWADAGAPEGDPKDAPPAPVVSDNSGWRFGKPDLILTPSEEFHLGPTGSDTFRCFVIPTGLTENKWVIGYDVKPGNPRVVHHTLHFFDTSGQGRQLAQRQQDREKGQQLADHGPGYPVSMGVGFVAKPAKKGEPATFGGIGGWAPGQAAQFVPRGAGWLLPKGSDFLIQTHYHRNGQAATDRTQVGLYFAKEPVEQPWQTLVLAGLEGDDKIPAGQADYVAHGAFYLHTDAILHTVLPHMHLLGKRVKVTMTPPNGRPVTLIEIPAWDYRWQETYWFKEPIVAKRGTKLEIEAVFDNSETNPNNPTKPPKEVKVGEETTDEMLFGFFGVTSTKSPYERIRTYAFPPAELGAAAAPAKGEWTAVLGRRLGTWEQAVEIKPVLGEGNTVTSEQIGEKAFGGTFLQIRSRSGAAGAEMYEMLTYDPAAQKYRMWTYTAQGAKVRWTGVWDEPTTTMTWSGTFQGGYAVTLKWKFVGDDRMETHLTAKSAGATVLTINGAATRKK